MEQKQFNNNMSRMRQLQELKENVQKARYGEKSEAQTIYEDLLDNIGSELKRLDQEQRRIVNGS